MKVKKSTTIRSLIVLLVFLMCSNLRASTGFEKELDNLSAAMGDKIAAAGKKKVAVVDFTDLQGNVTELGRFIAEEFSISLAGAGKGITVVDRTHLKSIIKEHKLSEKGLIDPVTARKLGKVAGVEVLVTGTLTPLGESVRLSIKILDTETAVVIDAKRGNIAMTDAIKNLMGTGAASTTGTKSPVIRRGKSIKAKTVEDFLFEVKKIEISGQNLICTLMITNNAEDRYLGVCANSAAFDDSGNEYWPRYIQIANQREGVSPNNRYSYVWKTLITGVPTKTVLQCEGASQESSMITSLVIRCRFGEKEIRLQVTFRNIPISK